MTALLKLITNKSNVTLYTTNGAQMHGIIKSISKNDPHMSYITFEDHDGRIRHVFMHAISTIDEH